MIIAHGITVILNAYYHKLHVLIPLLILSLGYGTVYVLALMLMS